ncbi:hypothetical protein HDU92_007944 [Lobulomyces angularis]|nr:hypothetical protein HDU92_007944 [Lobulomyces angularis]
MGKRKKEKKGFDCSNTNIFLDTCSTGKFSIDKESCHHTTTCVDISSSFSYCKCNEGLRPAKRFHQQWINGSIFVNPGTTCNLACDYQSCDLNELKCYPNNFKNDYCSQCSESNPCDSATSTCLKTNYGSFCACKSGFKAPTSALSSAADSWRLNSNQGNLIQIKKRKNFNLFFTLNEIFSNLVFVTPGVSCSQPCQQIGKYSCGEIKMRNC